MVTVTPRLHLGTELVTANQFCTGPQKILGPQIIP